MSQNALMVQILGQPFELRMPDGEIYAQGRRVIAQCMALDVRDENAARVLIERICTVTDEALGRGAMAKIAQGRVVTLPFALKIFNELIGGCAARYKTYLKREYLGGEDEA